MKNPQLKIASITKEKNLETVWEFTPAVKKYGTLRFVENISYGGAGYKARLLAQDSSEINEKEIWDIVLPVLEAHKTGRKMF